MARSSRSPTRFSIELSIGVHAARDLARSPLSICLVRTSVVRSAACQSQAAFAAPSTTAPVAASFRNSRRVLHAVLPSCSLLVAGQPGLQVCFDSMRQGHQRLRSVMARIGRRRCAPGSGPCGSSRSARTAGPRRRVVTACASLVWPRSRMVCAPSGPPMVYTSTTASSCP